MADFATKAIFRIRCRPTPCQTLPMSTDSEPNNPDGQFQPLANSSDVERVRSSDCSLYCRRWSEKIIFLKQFLFKKNQLSKKIIHSHKQSKIYYIPKSDDTSKYTAKSYEKIFNPTPINLFGSEFGRTLNLGRSFELCKMKYHLAHQICDNKLRLHIIYWIQYFNIFSYYWHSIECHKNVRK